MSGQFLEDIQWIQTGENVEPGVANRPHEALQRNITKVYNAFVNRIEWIRDESAVFSWISPNQFRVSGNLVNRYVPGRPLRIYFLATNEGNYIVNAVTGSTYSPVSDSTTVTVELENLPESMEWVEHHIISNLVGLIRDSGMLDELASQVASEAVLSEWFVFDEFTYASDLSFTIQGNVTNRFQANRLLRLQKASNEMVYTYVTSATFNAATNTTLITVNDPEISTTLVSVASYLLTPARIEEFLNRSTKIITMTNEIDTLRARLNALAIADVDGLSTELSTIDGNITTLTSDINTLNSEMSSLATLVSNIDTTVSSLETQVSSINTTVGTINTTVNSLSTAVNTLDAAMTTVENRLDSIESNLNAITSSLSELNTLFNNFLEGGEALSGDPVLVYEFGNFVIKFATNMGSNFVTTQETLLIKFEGESEALTFKADAVALDTNDKTTIYLSNKFQEYIKTNLWEKRATDNLAIESVWRYLAPTKYDNLEASRKSALNSMKASILRQNSDAMPEVGHIFDNRVKMNFAEVSSAPVVTTWLDLIQVNSELIVGVKSYPTTTLANVQIITAADSSPKSISFSSAITKIVAFGLDYVIALSSTSLYRISLNETLYSANPTLFETGRVQMNIREYHTGGPDASTTMSISPNFTYSNIISNFHLEYAPSGIPGALISLQTQEAFLVGEAGVFYLIAAVGAIEDNNYFAFPVEISTDADQAKLLIERVVLNKQSDYVLQMFVSGTLIYQGMSFQENNTIYQGLLKGTMKGIVSYIATAVAGGLDDPTPLSKWGMLEFSESGIYTREIHAIHTGADTTYQVVKNRYRLNEFLSETNLVNIPVVSIKKRVEDNSIAVDNLSNSVANLQAAINNLTAAQVALVPPTGFDSYTNLQTAVEFLLTSYAPAVHLHSYAELEDIPQDLAPTASPNFYSTLLNRGDYSISNGIVEGALPGTVLKLSEIQTLLSQYISGSTGTSSDIFVTATPESGGERTFSNVPSGWEMGRPSEITDSPVVIPVTEQDLVIKHNESIDTGIFISITEIKNSPSVAFNYVLEAGAVATENGFTVIKDFFTRFDATSSIKLKIGLE